MAKQNYLNFVLNYGVYPYDVMFSFGETDKQLFSRLEKVVPDQYKDDIKLCALNNRAGICIQFGFGASIIRMPNIPKTPFDQDTLAHEIFHAVSGLLRRIGLEHTSDSEEAYAYAIGFLTKGAYEAIDKFKKKRRVRK